MSDTEQRLCRIACLGQLWERTSKHAQERLKILGFFADYGAAATSDAFDVSRRTLYRWKQCARPGGNPAAPTLEEPPDQAYTQDTVIPPLTLPAAVGGTSPMARRVVIPPPDTNDVDASHERLHGDRRRHLRRGQQCHGQRRDRHHAGGPGGDVWRRGDGGVHGRRDADTGCRQQFRRRPDQHGGDQHPRRRQRPVRAGSCRTGQR